MLRINIVCTYSNKLCIVLGEIFTYIKVQINLFLYTIYIVNTFKVHKAAYLHCIGLFCKLSTLGTMYEALRGLLELRKIKENALWTEISFIQKIIWILYTHIYRGEIVTWSTNPRGIFSINFLRNKTEKPFSFKGCTS